MTRKNGNKGGKETKPGEANVVVDGKHFEIFSKKAAGIGEGVHNSPDIFKTLSRIKDLHRNKFLKAPLLRSFRSWKAAFIRGVVFGCLANFSDWASNSKALYSAKVETGSSELMKVITEAFLYRSAPSVLYPERFFLVEASLFRVTLGVPWSCLKTWRLSSKRGSIFVGAR